MCERRKELTHTAASQTHEAETCSNSKEITCIVQVKEIIDAIDLNVTIEPNELTKCNLSQYALTRVSGNYCQWS